MGLLILREHETQEDNLVGERKGSGPLFRSCI